MFKIILFKLGFFQKYEIEVNDFHHQSPNQIIEFYYYKNCPKYLLLDAVLIHLRKKVRSCVGDLIYVKRINNWQLDKQLKY